MEESSLFVALPVGRSELLLLLAFPPGEVRPRSTVPDPDQVVARPLVALFLMGDFGVFSGMPSFSQHPPLAEWHERAVVPGVALG